MAVQSGVTLVENNCPNGIQYKGQAFDKGLGIVPSTPFQVDIDEQIVQVACGGSFCLALTQTAKLYAWGKNDYGQLGIGTDAIDAVSKPIKLEQFDNELKTGLD